MSNDPADTEIQPVAQFIAGLMALARSEDNADAEILDILEKHIVKETVPANSVRDATKALQQLAETRVEAAIAKGKQQHAGPNND